MTDPIVSEIERFEAPYGRQLVLQHVTHESGLALLRIRIREGNRFTILDVDAATAAHWGEAMRTWARANATSGSAEDAVR
jgi:hypothetical protein